MTDSGGGKKRKPAASFLFKKIQGDLSKFNLDGDHFNDQENELLQYLPIFLEV